MTGKIPSLIMATQAPVAWMCVASGQPRLHNSRYAGGVFSG
ncbi:hypothetical protein MIZ03_3505 [Rhodoferax lithotrophicus]|uniref:Uncharacterized protein n=1 Tax=Rhodoferax lithotrophicus TaxID=2798804 RepID=A0ABN6DCQ2_9BURK|nr:hypothetical protein MIZ03_3505 [Rhodoferax sp. MIZ03]